MGGGPVVGRELNPSDHTRKEVRRVLEKWVGRGWKIHKDGHWGKLYCPCEGRCTTIPVSGSPQNEGSHARRIDRLAARCPLPPDSAGRSLTGMPRE